MPHFLCNIRQRAHISVFVSQPFGLIGAEWQNVAQTTPSSKCTNEILISDVNSAKNSLAIIYMCLKMHCLKYVVNLI